LETPSKGRELQSPKAASWGMVAALNVSYLAVWPDRLGCCDSKCAVCCGRPVWPKHVILFIECKSCRGNLFPCLAVYSSPPLPPRFMKHTDLLFKQSLKSSDLQISSLNDQLYIVCI
jgi:hypothetical protein